MDEAGVVKQTTIEQVIQNHQLSTKSTEGIPMGEPSAPKILPLRFSQRLLNSSHRPTASATYSFVLQRNRSLQKRTVPLTTSRHEISPPLTDDAKKLDAE